MKKEKDPVFPEEIFMLSKWKEKHEQLGQKHEMLFLIENPDFFHSKLVFDYNLLSMQRVPFI
jgi:hypothetical protein